MPVKSLLVPLVVAVIGFAAVPESNAQFLPSFTSNSSASGSYFLDDGVNVDSLDVAKSSRLGDPVSVEGGIDSLQFQAAAHATPGSLGTLTATARPTRAFDFFGASVSAAASANFTDYFVIIGGEGVGSAGVSARVHGSQSIDSGNDFFGQTNYSFDLSYAALDPFSCFFDPEFCTPADQQQNVLSDARSLFGSIRPVRFSHEYETDFLFRYGQPFSLTAFLSAGARDGGTTDLESTASFALQLPDGASLISASGFGYAAVAAAVPEPGTYFFMAIGLVGFALDRRRRVRRWS